MGYPRRTADLVSQNNIFVDIANDRIGIGTDQPTVKLDVVGDAAVSGNLTVSGDTTIVGTLTYEDVTNIDSVGLITARSGMVVSGVSTFSANVNLGDNDTINLGDSNDLRIRHISNGDSAITEHGGGALYIGGSKIRIADGYTTLVVVK
jgi:hypothetical protein